MNYFDAVVLGIVEGLTEFLPVSSTGHLMITEKLLGMSVSSPSIGAYTAVIQMGAILAAVVYFSRDIVRIARAWFGGLASPRHRGPENTDYRMGWNVIVGTVPIVVVGLVFKGVIEGPFKSLWVVAGGLVLWSAVMVYAERQGRQRRGEAALTVKDALLVGIAQCVALVPGVSRSGATISAGLLLGLDRVAATRVAFFLGIPALLGAGLYELKDVGGIGAGPAVLGTLVAFVVAYASIAWLLRFVSHHSIGRFAPYRVVLGLLVMGLLASGVMSAT